MSQAKNKDSFLLSSCYQTIRRKARDLILICSSLFQNATAAAGTAGEKVNFAVYTGLQLDLTKINRNITTIKVGR